MHVQTLDSKAVTSFWNRTKQKAEKRDAKCNWRSQCDYQLDCMCFHFSVWFFHEADVSWIIGTPLIRCSDFWTLADVYGCVSTVILAGNNKSFVSGEDSELLDEKCCFMGKTHTRAHWTQREWTPLNSTHWNRLQVKGQDTSMLSGLRSKIKSEACAWGRLAPLWHLSGSFLSNRRNRSAVTIF